MNAAFRHTLKLTFGSVPAATILITLIGRSAVADEVVRIVDLPVTDEAMSDLTFLASDKGISLADAIRDYSWEPAVAEYVDEVRAAYDSFTRARINEDRSVTIGFRGDVPEEVRFDPRLENLAIEFLGGLAHSERDLRARQLEVHFAFREAGFVRFQQDSGSTRVGAVGPLAGQDRDFFSRLDLVDNALPGVAVSTS